MSDTKERAMRTFSVLKHKERLNIVLENIKNNCYE